MILVVLKFSGFIFLSVSVVLFLLAVNLWDDANTTGAVYGQLAGAYYGEEGIPGSWWEKIAMRETIIDLAERLFSYASAEMSHLDG